MRTEEQAIAETKHVHDDCITTREMCEQLGVGVSIERIAEITGIEPDYKTKTGAYWSERSVRLVAMGLAQHLINVWYGKGKHLKP